MPSRRLRVRVPSSFRNTSRVIAPPSANRVATSLTRLHIEDIEVTHEVSSISSKNVGITLSAGGAKGSFQVGALTYLYNVKDIRPRYIVGTSAGAINGIKLAEGEMGGRPGYRSGLPGLISMWAGLKENKDMFVPTKAFKDVENLDDFINSVMNWSVGFLFGGFGAGLVLGWPGVVLGLAAAIVTIFFGGSNIEDKIRAFVKSESIYRLDPIENKLRSTRPKKLDLDLVRNSDIGFLAGTVSIESGKLRYVNERGEMFERDNLRRPIARNIDVIDAVMASASIPVIYNPRKIDGETYVDGGTREFLPLQATIDLGADECYAIWAGSPYRDKTDVSDLESLSGFKFETSIVPIATAGIDLLIDEVRKGDEQVRAPEGLQKYVIMPNYSVYGEEVKQSLIKINIAYGYMRAFDVTNRSLDLRTRIYLRGLADRIIVLRKIIYILEGTLFDSLIKLSEKIGRLSGPGNRNPPPREWDQIRKDVKEFASIIVRIRSAKRLLHHLVNRRRDVGGDISIPSDAPQWHKSWEYDFVPPRTVPWNLLGSNAIPKDPWKGLQFTVRGKNLGGYPSQSPDIPYHGWDRLLLIRTWEMNEFGFKPPSGGAKYMDLIDRIEDKDNRLVHRIRSLPNGNSIESEWGNAGEFHNIWIENGSLVHYYGSAANNLRVAKKGKVPSLEAGLEPLSISLLETSYSTGQDDKRKLGLLLHYRSSGGADRLAMYQCMEKEQEWKLMDHLEVSGERLTGITGRPSITTSNWKDKGIIHLLVQKGRRVLHLWMDTDIVVRSIRKVKYGVWKQGSQISLPAGHEPLGTSIIHVQKDADANEIHALVHSGMGGQEFLAIYALQRTGSGFRWNKWFETKMSSKIKNPFLLYAGWEQQGPANFIIGGVLDGPSKLIFYKVRPAPGGRLSLFSVGQALLKAGAPVAAGAFVSNYVRDLPQGKGKSKLFAFVQVRQAGKDIFHSFVVTRKSIWNVEVKDVTHIPATPPTT